MVVAATVACIALAGAASAQEQRVAYVQVLDQQGRPVTDLAPEEFQVAEDRVPGRVVSARIGTDPMRVALLVDNGEAMRAGQAENPMRDAVAGFIETLPSRHLVSLFTIGGQIRQVVDFTADRGELVEEARGLFTDQTDGVRFVDSIRETLERRYDEDEMWPVFVALITDSGEASAFLNERRYRRFVDSLRARGAIVHVVQWNSARRARVEESFGVSSFAGGGGAAVGERFAPRGRRSLVDSDAGGRGTSATHTIALNLTEPHRRALRLRGRGHGDGRRHDAACDRHGRPLRRRVHALQADLRAAGSPRPAGHDAGHPAAGRAAAVPRPRDGPLTAGVASSGRESASAIPCGGLRSGGTPDARRQGAPASRGTGASDEGVES